MLKLRNKNRDKQLKETHEASSNMIAIISTIVILLGGFIFSYNYVKTKKMKAYSYMNNIFYVDKDTTSDTEDIKEGENPTTIENTNANNITYEYIGYLEIPQINLKKGFVSKDSKDNDVEKNILIVKQSDYPDKEKGNFIIAGHSGTGYKAFFNDLYKLKKGNTIYVEYKDNKYTYKIEDIYKQKKVGTIAIYRDYDRTTLTLVTCTNNDSEHQTVYIAYR